VLLPHDYVNLALTGEAVAEAGDASGTGWFDVAARRWDERSAVMIDDRLPDLLAPLLAAGAPAGALNAGGSELLGLPRGVPVSAGGGDNMCAAIGSGATRPGVVVVSLGTSGTAFAFADHPVIDPEGLIAAFCDSTGGWLPLLCVMNLTGVTEEVRAAFGAGGAPADHAALTGLAQEVPPGCDGVLWLPYLAGERVPDLPQASGTLLGLRPGSLRPGVLYRAALEGTSLNLAWGMARLASLGVRPTEVRLVGGAAANPLWRSILADVLGLPVRRLAEDESAALGAALQACWTVRRAAGEDVSADAVAAAVVAVSPDVERPDPGRAALYAERRQAFAEAVAAWHGVDAPGR
jgi:sugar (pentulose or hexulose) kinase